MRSRTPAELFSAYETYLGTPLPAEMQKYFTTTVHEYQSDQRGVRWYEQGQIAGADFYEALGATYPWYYREHTWDKIVAVSLLKELGFNRIVEFGSANGSFLTQARAAGIEGWGVDITEDTLRACRQKGFTMFHFDRIPNPAPPADALVMLQTIEHVKDPVAFIQGVLERVPCNAMFLSTPCYESILGHSRDPLSWPPHHQTAWSELGFKHLAEAVGFKLLCAMYEPLCAGRLEDMLRLEGSRDLYDLPSFPEGPACAELLETEKQRGTKWAMCSHSIAGLFLRA